MRGSCRKSWLLWSVPLTLLACASDPADSPAGGAGGVAGKGAGGKGGAGGSAGSGGQTGGASGSGAGSSGSSGQSGASGSGQAGSAAGGSGGSGQSGAAGTGGSGQGGSGVAGSAAGGSGGSGQAGVGGSGGSGQAGSGGSGGSGQGGGGAGGSGGSGQAGAGGAQGPTVNAGPDQQLTWPEDRATLGVAVSAGATVEVTQLSGPTASVVRQDGGAFVATALREGTYQLRATATDAAGKTSTDDVQIQVLPAAKAPGTPLDWAQALPAPVFRPGHGLPPLTRWTGTHVLEFQQALAERYFYALDLGDTSSGWDGDFANPNGTIAKKIALKKKDPARYKLSIQVYRPMVSGASKYLDKHPGSRLTTSGETSPEAPLALFQEVADVSLQRFKPIVAKVAAEVPSSPFIDVVLNGGEYALGVWTDNDDKWLNDPVVSAAIKKKFGLPDVASATGAQRFQYLSERKQAQEQIITDAHVAANPGGMYVYYITWSAGWKNRWSGWWRYTFDYPIIKTLSSPSSVAFPSIYYRDYSSQDTGWDGDKDSLSQLINAQLWQTKEGAPVQYLSTCGGWPHTGSGFPADEVIATDDSYMGYLKAAYTVGLIGAVGGYFSNPGWGQEAQQQADTMPNWLRQLVTLGEVHALFSHLEAFVRQGTLLPGPGKHKWSKSEPAFELVASAGGAPDQGVRVVARQAPDGARWLVTLWAFTGSDRAVQVSVDPSLPPLDLQARTAGSVYVVDAKSGPLQVTLLDPDAMHPTDTLLPGDAW